MAYTPTDWEPFPSERTLITAARLNNMESGIVSANQMATQSRQGQMTSTDKIKLDSLAQAEVDGTTLII
ncbi:MAG: hypothetical protein K5673_02455 [Lachnospiraceae bacterium]|nr:hypothetical protein [Lachnospiraceae bacterium]